MQDVDTAQRIAIADDHLPTRRMVRRLLEEAGYEVVGEAGNGNAAVIAAIVHRPDIILLDVQMYDDGLTAAERIAEEVPDASVVMLTASTDAGTLRRCLRAGALGVLAKDDDLADLPAALRRVLEGEVSLPAELQNRLEIPSGAGDGTRAARRRLLGRRHTETPPPTATDQDAERILPHLRAGETIAATARTLGLTQDEVRRVAADLLPAGR